MHDKKSLTQWEELVFTEHALHRGKDKMITELLYLQICRQWRFYGSTFFYAKYKPPTQGFYTQEFAGDVVIGVNDFGVHIIDPLVMVRKKNFLLHSFDLVFSIFLFIYPESD